ncbi:MAG: ABC transporter permease [Phycisphaerales bacterium JB038]
MGKIVQVALREFISTVTTKGFLIGVLIVPGMMVVAIFAVSVLWNDEAPAVRGSVALVDRSGMLTEEVRSRINPIEMNKERDAEVEAKVQELADQAGDVIGALPAEALVALRTQAEEMVGPASSISIEPLPDDTDLEEAKGTLREGESEVENRLALVEIDEHAVVPDENGRYGSYRWFARPRLDDRVQNRLRWKVNSAIVDVRVRETGQDPDELRRLLAAGAMEAKTVTGSGEVSSNAGEALAMMLPLGFMMLLWISTFTGGQYLLTTTIEEKSSRVIEVLLSALSPVQLMTGKIIGQMAVGLMIMMIYASLGIGAMVTFALMDFLEISDLLFLTVFFFIAFFFVASMMAAIGSAVNDMREAQSLMTPVMLVLIIPMMLWMPIARDPNSTFSVVLSLVPPISPFAMMVRLAATEPVPFWQIAVSIVLGVVAVYLTIRGAAKIFRIGVLMYGKPPNFLTLLKWIRMA